MPDYQLKLTNTSFKSLLCLYINICTQTAILPHYGFCLPINNDCHFSAYLHLQLIQVMNKAWAAIAGVAAAGLFSFFYFQHTYSSNQETEGATRQQIRQILQQIKYQMLIVSVNFAEHMGKEVLEKIPKPQLQPAILKLKHNLMQMYQQKEDIVLNKHALSKDDFAAALDRFHNDQFIASCREQIENMMEQAVQGKYPDLQVPPQALQVNQKDAIRNIYQRVCQRVVVAVWNKLAQLSKQDPAFDCKNDQHYKIAVRQVNVYRLRAAELEATGYSPQWGCPNEIFFKTMENYKIADASFKLQVKTVEKAYNYILEVVSNNPFNVTDQYMIHEMMEEEIYENVQKLTEEQKKLQNLELGSMDNDLKQTNYFFEKGKLLQNSLNESKAKMGRARGKSVEIEKTG